MNKSEVAAKSVAASLKFLKTDIYKNANLVMVYMPLGNETDTTQIIKQAFNDGKSIAVPVTNGDTGEITPKIITENTVFKQGAFSVSEPINAQTTEIKNIDVVIVPGIAFDIKGRRIGFGKGCYDKFLRNCPAIKIGICYEFQLSDEIPAEVEDIWLEAAFSEHEMTEAQLDRMRAFVDDSAQEALNNLSRWKRFVVYFYYAL